MGVFSIFEWLKISPSEVAKVAKKGTPYNCYNPFLDSQETCDKLEKEGLIKDYNAGCDVMAYIHHNNYNNYNNYNNCNNANNYNNANINCQTNQQRTLTNYGVGTGRISCNFGRKFSFNKR